MLYVTHYEVVGDRSKERQGELMAILGERGAAPGQLHHFVYADGGGGLVVGEETTRLYEDALSYAPYLSLSTRMAVPVEDAVPQIMAWING